MNSEVTQGSGVLSVSELAYQLFYGLPNRERYLTKFESRQSEYDNRVKSSVLVNYYLEMVQFRAAELIELKLDSAPFFELITDIDGLGNDITTFFNNLDLIAIRDGGCWVDVSEDTLTLVSEKSIESSDKNKIVYRTFDNKKVTVNPEMLISYWYNRGLPEPGKLVFSPLFQDVIFANLAHFKANSEYDALVQLYGNPVLVRVDDAGLNLNRGLSRPPIDFRERNRIVDLNVGGELYFLGLNEVNAAVLRERIMSLTEWLENKKESFVFPASGEAKSATEIDFARQVNAEKRSAMMKLKTSNLRNVLLSWCYIHFPQFANQANSIEVLDKHINEGYDDNSTEIKGSTELAGDAV